MNGILGFIALNNPMPHGCRRHTLRKGTREGKEDGGQEGRRFGDDGLMEQSTHLLPGPIQPSARS